MTEALTGLAIALITALIPLIPYVVVLLRAYLINATKAAGASTDAAYNAALQAGLETIVATAAKQGLPKVDIEEATKTLEVRFPEAMAALKPSAQVLGDKLTKAIVDVEARLAQAAVARPAKPAVVAPHD